MLQTTIFRLAELIDDEYGRENGPGSEWLTMFAEKLSEKYKSWQPIETAPNEEYVLIFCAGAGIPAIAKFEHESRAWTALGGVDSFDNPVYWMPLPESPNATVRRPPETDAKKNKEL